jgi:hypothetical protein
MRPREEEAGHWSDEELIARLYGLNAAGAAEEHLDSCSECGLRWRALSARRDVVLRHAELEGATTADELQLRRQREAVWARIEAARARPKWRWAPAGMAALVVLAGVVLVSPPRFTLNSAKPGATISDTQLFAELDTISAPENLRAAVPLSEMFERVEREEEE